MVRVVGARWLHVGLLWWMCCVGVAGIIEIVEEQNCHDSEFRLTCRDLQTHIAILEAWYTSLDNYYNLTTNQPDPTNQSALLQNDAEFNRVYYYSSPKHNGFYQQVNHSNFENVTRFLNGSKQLVNESFVLNDTIVEDLLDVSGDFENSSETCADLRFSTSYASWHEGDGRRRKVAQENSINLRAPFSYRCTGVNHCSFILAEDYPPSVSWITGVIYIKYACFDDSVSIHFCNRDVVIAETGADSEGYIRSPGYPHFYVGEACGWRLRAAPEQKIRITLLDVSLRSIGPFENECTDYIMVQDSSGESMLSSCDQVEFPLQLTSQTNSVDITVQAKSQGAFPKRGVLIHYKSIGCVTVLAPSDGYLVYRNAEVAHYMCNVNYVFADTRERARIIWCYQDNRWNDSVSSCVKEATLPVVKESSGSESTSTDTKLPHAEPPNMLIDIVIPSLLIAALFIGNAFIVLIIYKYRKRKPEDCEDEFNTIPLSSNGNAGNAV